MISATNVAQWAMQLGKRQTSESDPAGAAHVLIVGSGIDQLPPLRRLLDEMGFAVSEETSVERAIVRAHADAPHLLLCPARAGTVDAVDVLRQLREAGIAGFVIVLTNSDNDELGLAAMREGAYDILRLPVRPDELRLTVRRAVEHQQLLRDVRTLKASLGAHLLNGEMVAESKSMRGALDLAATLAEQDGPVLITGESGTGKELLARAIHRMSQRNHGPVISVPCDTIPAQLLETEFFGDDRRVFDRAAGGTVLFEEITALPLRLQEQLLEVIEAANDGNSSVADARVIGTSAKNVAEEVAGGKFLTELHRRLDPAHICLPPLRERPEDIPGLLAHFAHQAAAALGRPISVTPQALSLLTAYPWPGNVRELKHEVERAAALSATGRLDRGDFGLAGPGAGGSLPGSGNTAQPGPTLKLKPQVEAFERNAIRRALTAASGNRREAAQLLGVSLRTLFYKLRRYGLE